MLYLAEVQKKAGLLGGGKAELKLLACQRSEQNWSAVSGDEIVSSDDANNYNPGALVMVDIGGNRQVQRIQDAGRQLVGILQNFSKLQERFKGQEDEIEQWKQSLTYQSQELNRREMEMESRQAQLEEMEQDIEQFEQQRQEIAASREEVEQLRAEIERKNQELEGAWAHLRGEMQKLEERQGEMQSAQGLDAAEAQRLQASLEQLSGLLSAADVLPAEFEALFGLIGQQQEILNQHWQNLEQQQASVSQLQAEVEQRSQSLQEGWQVLQQSVDALVEAKASLVTQQTTLSLKEAQLTVITERCKTGTSVADRLQELAQLAGQSRSNVKVDTQALEDMPVDKLQAVVQDLEKDLEKVVRFVNDQEEELAFELQAIEELQQKIAAANDYDRLSLETELAEERDRYQMLNETLVGQRRNLQEREEILIQHQSILNRRQGLPMPEGADAASLIDIAPVLSELDVLRQQQDSERQQLETELDSLRQSVTTAQTAVDQQITEQGQQRQSLEEQQRELQAQQVNVSELQGKIHLYEETLQPIQNALDGLRQKLEESQSAIAQLQENRVTQSQIVTDIQQAIQSASAQQSPELAAS